MPKHVGVDVCHTWCYTQYICWVKKANDCKNMHGINNIKLG